MAESRKLVEQTVNFDSPARIPRQCWLLPWAAKKYPEYVKLLKNRFPDDIESSPVFLRSGKVDSDERYKKGIYIDDWNCRFDNIHGGVIGIVKKTVMDDWKKLDNYKAPDHLLNLDIDTVNSFCKGTDRFVLSGCVPRPFERYQFIRGMENALIDILTQPDEMFQLFDLIHEHYCKEIEVWSKTDIDAISFMDDWGTQSGLIASPEIFRSIFKPMYKEYCEIAHQNNKYIFMHSDGNIIDLFPDLIEIGIDAINSQVKIIGFEKLYQYKGMITFWGEIDRQDIIPNATIEEIKKNVSDLFGLFENGGVIAQCEFGPGANPDNIISIYNTWNNINETLYE